MTHRPTVRLGVDIDNGELAVVLVTEAAEYRLTPEAAQRLAYGLTVAAAQIDPDAGRALLSPVQVLEVLKALGPSMLGGLEPRAIADRIANEIRSTARAAAARDAGRPR